MRYLDASIPLGVMLRAPKAKLDDMREIMLRISDGREKAITTIFTLAEIAHVLERAKKPKNKIREYLSAFLGCSGLKLIGAENHAISDKILELYDKYDIDFIDAHHVLTMRKMRIKEIYSQDAHYDKFNDIIRLEK
ncbi:MAG: type II toxin-antitoxin system VapC family toxin [Methanosarcinales archaeon]|nr:MAG: type II toxin-antitoxin system VapC family toxin [Methanosarcinales archaeon]